MDQLELQRVFQLFDLNHDGLITHSELSASLDKLNISMSSKDLAEVLDMVDSNHDGCVDMDEFRDLYNSLTELRENDRDLREAFTVFDRNGDGFITAEELKAVLSLMGVGRGEDCCRKMIRRVDVDGDGRVDYREFRNMMIGGTGGSPFSD